MRGQTACLDRYVQWSEIMARAGKIDNDRLIGGGIGVGGGGGRGVMCGMVVAGTGGGKQYQNISSWRQPPKVTRDAFANGEKKKKKKRRRRSRKKKRKRKKKKGVGWGG